MGKMKNLDIEVKEAFKKHFDRVPVSLMKIPEIYKNIEEILKFHGPDKEALQEVAFEALVKHFRMNK